MAAEATSELNNLLDPKRVMRHIQPLGFDMHFNHKNTQGC